LADSHQLVQYWNEELGHTDAEYVPRVVGCSIPRPNAGLAYTIFVLAHFKPFGALQPLIPNGETFKTIFKNYRLTSAAQTTVANWDATNESEDARDAECMKKKAKMTNESKALTTSLFLDDSNIPIIDGDTGNSFASSTNFTVNQHLLLLHQSNWFNPPTAPQLQPSVHLPVVTDILLKQ
jgi:hypothetical protein